MEEVQSLRWAVKNVQELLTDIEQGLHIPVRFRKAPFTPDLRTKYASYLLRVLTGLKKRLDAMEGKRYVR